MAARIVSVLGTVPRDRTIQLKGLGVLTKLSKSLDCIPEGELEGLFLKVCKCTEDDKVASKWCQFISRFAKNDKFMAVRIRKIGGQALLEDMVTKFYSSGKDEGEVADAIGTCLATLKAVSKVAKPQKCTN